MDTYAMIASSTGDSFLGGKGDIPGFIGVKPCTSRTVTLPSPAGQMKLMMSNNYSRSEDSCWRMFTSALRGNFRKK